MTSSMGCAGAPHQAAMLANTSAEQFPALTTSLGTSPATDLRTHAPTAGVKPAPHEEQCCAGNPSNDRRICT